jgi:hypothetical protein
MALKVDRIIPVEYSAVTVRTASAPRTTAAIMTPLMEALVGSNTWRCCAVMVCHWLTSEKATATPKPTPRARVLAGLAWWALAAGHPDQAAVFAADAAEGASASGDPATQLVADTAVAAVKAIADPTRDHAEAFTVLALRRAQGLAYRSLTDEPDVAALTARLALLAR